MEYKHLRIFVVNDGSHDETSKRAQEAGATVIDHRTNEGLGVAIATGVDAALRSGADIIVTMDSDGQFKGYDVPELIELLLDGRADITIGSRYLREDFIPIGTSWAKLTASRFMSYVVSQIVWETTPTSPVAATALQTPPPGSAPFPASPIRWSRSSTPITRGLCLVEVLARVRTRREHGKSKMTANFLHAAGILFILMRRMRDIRPLMFFTLYAFGSVFTFVSLVTSPAEQSRSALLPGSRG
ncbi:MAG: glycosyltransferase family 2 protein [Planctomycetota bacterium]